MIFSSILLVNGINYRVDFNDATKAFTIQLIGAPTVDLFDEASGLTITVDKIALDEGKIRRK